MADQLKTYKAKRAVIKATLTRFKTFLSKFTSEQSDIISLKARLENIYPILDEFNNIQFEIEILLANDDEIAVDTDERQNFEDFYYHLVSEAKGHLSKYDDTNSNALSKNEIQTNKGFDIPHTIEQNQNMVDIKLPEVNLPSFDGSLQDWLFFRDTFKSVIHEKHNLSDVHKFHYLRLALKGEAAEVIRDLHICDDSYEIAWKGLFERYEDESVLISYHTKALINIVQLTKESHTNIRQLHDTLLRNLRVLKKLGEPTEYWDTLIIHLVSSKLDLHSKRKWESKIAKLKKPSLNDFTEFLNDRYKTLQKTKESEHMYSTGFPNKSRNKTNSFLQTNKLSCVICKQEHTIYNCSIFLELTSKDRYQEAKRLKLCLNCLRRNHETKDCKSIKCRKCAKAHHTLLHFERNLNMSTKNNDQTNTLQQFQSQETHLTSLSNSYCNTKYKNCILLSTALVTALDKSGNEHNCRILLDSGSQSNFISKHFCNKLGLQPENIKIMVNGLNHTSSSIKSRVNVKIHSRINSFNTTLSCLVIDNITSNMPCMTFDKTKLAIPPNLVLADPEFNISKSISMLLGADIFWELLCAGQIKLGYNAPILQKTCFGWIVSGPLYMGNQSEHTTCNLNVDLTQDIHLDNRLQQFWEIEETPHNKAQLSAEEYFCEQYFIKNTYRNTSGRFVVNIPLKEPISKLGDSRQLAEKQLYNLEKRLAKNPVIKAEYTDFLNEYIKLNHMTLLPQAEINDGYFFPHHCVLKETSLTTKLRVVFNGSAKSSSGYSLNDLMIVGPNIQEELFSILIRFRKHNYVLSADIAKMYRQILVNPKQRYLQRILWRSNSQKPVSIYELNTVTYGTASAAYLAIRCVQEIAHQIHNTNPKISEIILHDFYVDDLLTGGSTPQEILNLKIELTQIFASYGFDLRKWVSNNDQLTSNKTHEIEFLNLGTDKLTKTLGLLWHPKLDILSYSIKLESNQATTKRSILSSIAQIFDPLGLIAPIVINAKIIMQKLWQLQISWDESIPLNLHTMWISFRQDLNNLNKLNIPRHILCQFYKSIELHGFADASQRAYGACIYVRTLDQQNQYHCNLLCAKTRVAPLKVVTIPKLELCAALLLAELMNKVKHSLKLQFDKILYWSDSTIVISWINNTSHIWKVFVANRISSIQSLTNPDQWHYIPTAENPADLLSRGTSSTNLLTNNLWWHGPKSLLVSENDWASTKISNLPIKDLPELNNKSVILTLTIKSNFQCFPLLNKYSTLLKLQRIFAYVLRFINNLENKTKTTGPLDPTELNNSLQQLIKLVQAESFQTEIIQLKKNTYGKYLGRLSNLNPFIDQSGILRVGGRLKNSKFDFEKRHPAILPKDHSFSLLIARYEHIRLLHAGPQQLLASLRERFWPLSGRNLARKVVHECIKCFRFNATPVKHLMGELPSDRVTPYRPFVISGIDYAGPVMLKDRTTRNYKTIKAYIALFVCFSTKAIHLELVGDLTTDTFLAALKRFMARRGKCSKIYSDNATTFLGANNQLNEFLNSSHDNIKSKLAQEGIDWNFIPPKSPHFGGLWEAGVKSVKYHLRRVIGETPLTFEEFATILAQIEACLNSRPISSLSNDPNDPSPLTPSHFIIGEAITSVPEPDYRHVSLNRLKRFQLTQRMVQHFWSRWSKEYISQLQIRSKWTKNHQQLLKPNALVLIKEDNLPPLKWLMGRVLELYPGRDGIVRAVAVQTTNGIYKRPAVKLVTLPEQD